jgi:hypothetical protein
MIRLQLRNTDLIEPEPQRDADPASMAPPPNLIIQNIKNLGAGAASKFLPGAGANLK